MSAVLEKDPSDHTARVLRANVALTRLRLDPNGASEQMRRRLLNDLISVSACVGAVGEAADWVPARALIVMGDLLAIEGDKTITSASTDERKVAEAKSLFDAARHYYAALSEQQRGRAISRSTR